MPYLHETCQDFAPACRHSLQSLLKSASPAMERYNNPEPYDPHAGPWPIQYSEEDKQAQREAGKELQQRFEKAIAEGQHEFHIPEGVYRIDKVFRVDGHDGLHIRASNVEIVAEGDDKPSHFE